MNISFFFYEKKNYKYDDYLFNYIEISNFKYIRVVIGNRELIYFSLYVTFVFMF